MQSIAGSLDLSVQENVKLYKITLAPGHFWRLGVELDAQRIGSNLSGALTLFDQSGNVLDTRDAGTGLPSDPNDPYIFTGLNPGVYYIGVSGAGNLAGQTGGYNPVTGTTGSLGQVQLGGAYQLQVVADPADSLTQVVGSSLQQADALDPTPTGLTLSFSGPIDPNSLMSNSPVLVYDASGLASNSEQLPGEPGELRLRPAAAPGSVHGCHPAFRRLDGSDRPGSRFFRPESRCSCDLHRGAPSLANGCRRSRCSLA